MTTTERVDIIIPVFNNLSWVRDCLEQVVNATRGEYRVTIVDDASDERTRQFLDFFTCEHDQFELISHIQRQGFVASCNEAMRQTQAPFAVLLNSDVLVTPGWLERMLEVVAQDPTIAVVNPLSNFAANLSIPLAPGCSYRQMDQALQSFSQKKFPDVVTCIGFCMLVVRKYWQQLGGFDSAYGMGYGEDSDFGMRALSAGLRTVVADHVFVYHQGRTSFVDSSERMRAGRQRFLERWEPQYLQLTRKSGTARALQAASEMFCTRSRRVLGLDCRRYLLSSVRNLRAGNLRSALGALKGAAYEFRFDKLPRVGAAYYKKIALKQSLRVVYLLPKLHCAGGVISVVQLVNRLVLEGVQATIACVEPPALEVVSLPLLVAPIIFKNKKDLIRRFPSCDVVVATLHSTASWAAELAAQRGVYPVYFIQDYGPWTYANQPDQIAQVLASYQLIEQRIVKSDWLKQVLAREHGVNAHKIRLGMNLDLFYPRSSQRSTADKGLNILVLSRPHLAYGGFEYVPEFMFRVSELYPHARFQLFGAESLPDNGRLSGLPIKNLGVVPYGNSLAELYSQSDIFLDPSDFQGFGRPGLEAMACGRPAILTNRGGVSEYAQHEKNCLLVAPKAPSQWVAAVQQLIETPQLMQQFGAAGLLTAQAFDYRREGQETKQFFEAQCLEERCVDGDRLTP